MLSHSRAVAASPSRVVLLGAKGFVPSHLIAHLVRVGWPHLALGSTVLDLTLPESSGKLAQILRPTDTLVFAAALTPEKGRDTATLIRNLRMVENVSVALKASPCEHAIYFSSDSVYGWDSPAITEATPPSPDNLYGVMHLAREVALRECTRALGIPLCILRCCAVYGPGDTHNAYGPNRFVRTALASGKIEMFGQGEDTRDHVHINDVVRLTCLSIEHQSAGVLNVVSGRSVTFEHVAAEIAKTAATPVEISFVPRAAPATHRSFSRADAEAAFPTFRPITIEEGVSKLVRDTSQNS